MPSLFQPDLTLQNVKSLSPAALAYIGDAVFELFVRSRFLLPARKIHDFHLEVVSHVKAEAQASLVQKILPLLSSEEEDVFRRARNSAIGKPKRVSLQTYQQATGFEALFGYLYLTNQNRLEELFEAIQDC